MPIMHARYGRPKSNGVDDCHKLEGIAALLSADAALKPTIAIHSRHRLPDTDRKSHSQEERPCAHSNRAPRSHRRGGFLPGAHTTQPIPAALIALPTETIATEPAYRLPQPPLPAITSEFVPCRVQAAIEQHAVPGRHRLQLPAVASVPQAQLAAGACTITAPTMPRKPLTPLLH